MAFKQSPGRLSFSKTGHGLPSALKQIDDTDPTLKAKAEAEAKAKQQVAGPNTGGSKDVRTFSGTASAVIPGQKVTKFAKTPEEIAKWKAAPKENKDKFKSKTITESASVSDTGMDKPTTPVKPTVEKTKMSWFREDTNMTFGGHSTTGQTSDQNELSSYKNKNISDLKTETGKLNKFNSTEMTGDEEKVYKAYGSGINPFNERWKGNGGEAKRQTVISNAIGKLKERESIVAGRKAITDAKQKDRLDAYNARKAEKLKTTSPMRQVVSKKTAYDIKEASNQKMKPSARKHYAENAQAAMKNKKKK